MPVAEAAEEIEHIKTQARDLVIGRKLLLDEAQRQGIEVPPAEVEEAIDGLRKALATEAAFQAHLAKLDMSPQELRNFIHDAQKTEKLVKQAVTDVSDAGVGEISAYYESHPVEFTLPERVRVSHVLFKCNPADNHDKELARAKASKVKEEIMAGADFRELAAKYSDCPSGKSSGGDLGLLVRGMMELRFEEVAFSLKADEVSDPVETNAGYHLVLKKEHHPASLQPFDQVKDLIRVALRLSMENKALMDYISGLRKEALIEDDEQQKKQGSP